MSLPSTTACPRVLNPWVSSTIALEHALGSSGTRLLATRINHIEATASRYGIHTMCESNGMANASIIEKL